MAKRTSLTVVVNAHREGRILSSSLRSAEENINYALWRNSSYEFKKLLVMDDPDEESIISAEQFGETWTKLIVDFKDLGTSRNFGVLKSESDFVAFLDGDDLWGHKWLASGMDTLMNYPEPAIVHPELNYFFGWEEFSLVDTVFRSPSSTDRDFVRNDLASANLWTALSMSHRDVYLANPYIKVKPNSKIGFEDWSFNIETLAFGISHIVAPETVHFIRKKIEGSMAKSHSYSDSIFNKWVSWL